MKISINDECGTEFISALSLEGKILIENEDFIKWEGEYHKNGKWSYSEGGVALNNGIIIINQKSTHSAFNNKKIAIVIRDNKEIGRFFIMRLLSETFEKPKCPDNWLLLKNVWDICIEIVLNWAKPELAKECRQKWEQTNKFF